MKGKFAKKKVSKLKVTRVHPVVQAFIEAPPAEVPAEVVALVKVVAQPEVEIIVPEPVAPEQQSLWKSICDFFS
jgi:hypothetical protein